MSFNRSIWRTCSRVLGVPFRLLFGVWKRLTRNWKYGKVRNLVLGLPAVGALAICLWMSALVRANPETLRTDYLTSARAEVAAGNYENAEIYLHRLRDDLGSNDPQVEFELAVLFEETSRPDRADFIYRKLAPDTPSGGSGYGPAHRKRALAIANSGSNEDVGVLYRHLMLSDDPDAAQLAPAWAAYYLAQGEYDKAVERLEVAIIDNPGLNVFLANVFRKLAEQELAQAAIERDRGEQELAQAAIERARGEQEKAQAAFKRAAEHFRERLRDNEADHSLRVFYFQILLTLGDFEACETVLEQGRQLDPEGRYNLLLAGLCTTMHDVATQREGVPISELLALLRKALEYEPNFGPVYERLLLYGNAKIDGEKTITDVLNEMIASPGTETGMAHFILSLNKWNDEDFEACRFHLEQALRLQPNLPPALNNLAWILANQEPVDLARAEELINRALEYGPGDPKFLDTRAAIYVNQKRWNDAYNDLELALANNSDLTKLTELTFEIELHKSMVDICDQIGQAALAETHRRLVETLEAQKAAAETSAETPPVADPTTDAEPVDPMTDTEPAEPMADAESPDSAVDVETPDPGS